MSLMYLGNNADAPLQCELHRIAQQIVDDLLDPQLISYDYSWHILRNSNIKRKLLSEYSRLLHQIDVI